jgi:phenylpyruvate tautomerase PptA (4-oxalocrotonate tautomerase family)
MMSVLIEILNLAGNWIVVILDAVEPDFRDPFWLEE